MESKEINNYNNMNSPKQQQMMGNRMYKMDEIQHQMLQKQIQMQQMMMMN